MTEARTQGADRQRVVLLTGPSGAGRSTAINALEDLGYEAINNLPLSLVPRLLEGPPIGRPIALGIDVRNRDFSASALDELIDRLGKSLLVDPVVLFLDCTADELIRRYSETRRRHPLAPSDPPMIGIAREVDLLSQARDRADVLIDTSEMTPHDLRAEIARWFDTGDSARLVVSLQSFSYRRGVPRGADMVFDCRFLRNPHWDDALRALDGTDPRVAAYVEGDPRLARYFELLTQMLALLLPAQVAEGKSSVIIGFGCTGGQHRSVAIVEKLANVLAADGWHVSKRHRELERRVAAPASSAG